MMKLIFYYGLSFGACGLCFTLACQYVQLEPLEKSASERKLVDSSKKHESEIQKDALKFRKHLSIVHKVSQWSEQELAEKLLRNSVKDDLFSLLFKRWMSINPNAALSST